MPQFPKKLAKKLAQRKTNDALRKLGSKSNLVDFSSNDYLGLAKSKSIYTTAHSKISKEFSNYNGSTGSRLLSGNHPLYNSLEELLKANYQVDAALVYSSGYAANLGFFSSIPQRGDFIFFDELAHASIRDGILLSNAKSYKFKHNNLEDLKQIIERNEYQVEASSEIYIVTESVFSMDGDSPDLEAFLTYCKSKNYHLIVDEAHAVGVFGDGKGLLNQYGLQSEVFASIITFGKAIGGHGAAILGGSQLIQYLVNFSRSLMYSTGLAPHTLATTIAAYQELESPMGEKVQQQLKTNIQLFRGIVIDLGLQAYFITSNSAIQSILIPENKKVKYISRQLAEAGFDVKPILSPTVPEGEERLRFCIHSYNTENEILEVLQRLKQEIDA